MNSILRSFVCIASFIFACIFADNAVAQMNQIIIPEDVGRVLKGAKCFEGFSEYLPGNQICAVEETHLFGITDRIMFSFNNDRRIGMIVSGSKSVVDDSFKKLVSSWPENLEFAKENFVSRWSGVKGAIYRVYPRDGDQAEFFIVAFDQNAVDSLNLRYGFKDSSFFVSGSTIPDSRNPKFNRINGGVVSIFGIRVGEVLPYIECTKTYSSIGSPVSYKSIGTSRPCFKRSAFDLTPKKSEGPIEGAWLEIEFPANEQPAFGVGLTVLIVNNNVEIVTIGTAGISGQDIYLARLKDKFGPPTEFVPYKSKNLMGAEFETFRANWSFPEYSVFYEASLSRVDSGEIKVMSTVGASELRKREAALKAKNPGREL